MPVVVDLFLGSVRGLGHERADRDFRLGGTWSPDPSLSGRVGALPTVGIAPVSSRMRDGGSDCSATLTPSGASASKIAFVTAAGAPIAPLSPTPRALSGLGVWLSSL